MEEVLELYRTQEEFTQDQNELIEDLINEGELETEDLRINFKEWVYENYPDIPEEEVWDFDEHYSNGLTHRQNFKDLQLYLE